jgi:RNA polymerase sigma-70 factor (ECF subfamily)
MYSEDLEYVQRILAGESELFESLVRKYNRMAGAIAFGIVGDFHAAEDIVQEAFLKAFRVLHTLRDPGKFKPWFARLVRSKSLDALRRRPSHKPLEVSTEAGDRLQRGEAPRYGPTAEDDHLREESRRKVLEAVESLSREDRVVLVLKHMEGLSYKEIAEITGSTLSAIESRLFRARQALRKKLDPSKT